MSIPIKHVLTLMGTAAICDMKPYKPLITSFKTFDDLSESESGIYILVSGGLGTATVHSDQMQAELREVPGIPEITHASFVVIPGHHRVRITLPGVTDTVITTVALANRVTLLVASTGNGATRLFSSHSRSVTCMTLGLGPAASPGRLWTAARRTLRRACTAQIWRRLPRARRPPAPDPCKPLEGADQRPLARPANCAGHSVRS